MEAPQDKNSLEAIAAGVGAIVLALLGFWRWIIGRSSNGMSPSNKLILEELREIKESQHTALEIIHSHAVRLAVIENEIEKS